MTAPPDPHPPSLAALLRDGWVRLAEAVRVHGHGARIVTLATIGPHGAEARKVALREVHPVEAQLVVHTHAASAKVTQIGAGDATILFWEPDRSLQIRLSGPIAARPGRPEDWAALTAAQRLSYARPLPGTPVDAPALRHDPDPAFLAILAMQARRIDIVDLSRPLHLRAGYTSQDGWRGQWLGP